MPIKHIHSSASEVITLAVITGDEWQRTANCLEKFGVFGIGASPASLDVVDAQLVQPIGDGQLVLNGERYALVQRAVAKRCVVYLYLCYFPFFFLVFFATDYKIRQIQKTRPNQGMGRKFENTCGATQGPHMMRSAHSGRVFMLPPLVTVGESGRAYSVLVLLACAFRSATQEGYSEEVTASARTVGQWS